MKKQSVILIISLMILSLKMFAVQSEKTVTDPIIGEEIIIQTGAVAQYIDNDDIINHTNNRTGLIWEATDPSGMCRSAYISNQTYDVFAGWWTNNQRWSYFNETDNIPLWEYNLTVDDCLWQSISSDGTILFGSAGNSIYQFDPETGDIIWSFTEPNNEEIYNVNATENGEIIYYVSGTLPSTLNFTSINHEDSSENWNYTLPNGEYVWGLELSGNEEKLVLQQKHWLTACNSDGEILLQTEEHPNSQSLPSISDDGNTFVVGDQRGYVRLYSYNSTNDVYLQTWVYQYPYNGYYNWATAVAISADGSSIVSGSLNFEGDEEYSGTIAFFDVNSETPIWTNNIGDDEISCIDISEDGLIIAAASWGSLNDTSNDFWLFNSDNNQPFFEYECIGSPKVLDLSSDGTKCVVGGKAVHSRSPGHGGKLYYFDNSPIQGSILGIITDAETGDSLENVLVTAGIYSAISNASGEYLIEQVIYGNYTLTCELEEYELYSEEIIVDETIESINIAMIETVGIDNYEQQIPNFDLSNYPNPFNPTTTISFQLNNKQSENIGLEIYNHKGQIIRKFFILNNQCTTAHKYSIVWDGTDDNKNPVSSGIYFYKVNIGKYSSMKKMILMK